MPPRPAKPKPCKACPFRRTSTWAHEFTAHHEGGPRGRTDTPDH